MGNTVTLLDPTSEQQPLLRALLPRLTTLANTTIGLLDISKPKGKEFLDEVERRLLALGLGINVKRYSKPTFTRIAPVALCQQISVECDAVIEGLAD